MHPSNGSSSLYLSDICDSHTFKGPLFHGKVSDFISKNQTFKKNFYPPLFHLSEIQLAMSSRTSGEIVCDMPP